MSTETRERRNEVSERTQYLYAVTFHWKTGQTDDLEGWGNTEREAAADAMNSAGYGAGALAALDYWEAKRKP